LFGFSRAAWNRASREKRLILRDRIIPLDDLLVIGRMSTSRNHLKMRLFKTGRLQNKCYECEITSWRGKNLSLHLEHINGNKYDNRLENLTVLCPNCHSQTPTFGSKNRGKYMPRSLTVKRPALDRKSLGSNPSGAANIENRFRSDPGNLR